MARTVRELRTSRRWTQAELAKHLGLSKNRLSEIERGGGSFTAEQFLVILKLFNVASSQFVEQRHDPQQDLQNALARLGASQLHESTDVLPSDQLAEVNRAICEALVDGTPRLVAALAPVLVRHAEHIHWGRLYAEAQRLGVQRRLAWVTENTQWAIEKLKPRPLAQRRAALAIGLAGNFHAFDRDRRHLLDDMAAAEDLVDPTIRTERTRDALLRSRSKISERWAIVSSLQPEDFLEALKAAWDHV